MGGKLTAAQEQELWDAEVAGTPPAEAINEVTEDAADLDDKSEPTVPEAAETGGDPEKTAGATEVDDPYAGLSPVVRAQLEKIAQIEQQNAVLHQSLKTAEGRVSAMQREMDLAKKAKTQAAEAPSDNAIQQASGNLEKWERLKADFPDWAEGMEEMVAARFKSAPASSQGVDPEQVANLIKDQTQQVRQQMAQQLEEAKIELKYENWKDDVKTEDFRAWLVVQTDDVKSLAASDKARDATKMLDLYFASKAKPVTSIKEERNARLQAAVTQKGVGGAPAPKSVDDMTEAELWAYEARQIEKRGTY